MAFIPVPQCAQVQIVGQIDGQETINDLYFSHGSAITIVNLQALADAVDNWYWASILPELSNDFTYLRTIVTDLTTNTSGVAFQSANTGTGGVTGEANPNNVAACISFRTALRGRNWRGRNYIPGVPGSVVTLNTISPTFVTNVQAGYRLLKFGGTAIPGDWSWVVVSRFSGVDVNHKPIPRTSGVVELVTDALFVDSTVDSQRRRLPGRGR